MKLFKEDNFHYSRNIKVAVIISEFLILCLFLFWPAPSLKTERKIYFPENFITVADIPSTEITPPKPGGMPPPRPAIPIDFVPIEDPEVLPDVVIPDNSNAAGSKSGIGENKTGEYYASSFPFVPRQILEVVPSKMEGVSGYIKLSLKIGRDGFVKDHRIIAGTIKNQELIKNILDAVYKSRWQPISIEGEKIEYWIEKTYSFN